jgi:hypothetical protein
MVIFNSKLLVYQRVTQPSQSSPTAVLFEAPGIRQEPGLQVVQHHIGHVPQGIRRGGLVQDAAGVDFLVGRWRSRGIWW